MPSAPKPTTKKPFPFWLKVAIPFFALTLAAVIAWLFFEPHPVKLDTKFSGPSEAIDINGETYEQAIANQESFVVMVDNEACITTRKMREMMNQFPENLQFRYYRILWPEAIQTSLHQYVKYFPSLAIIKDGEVTTWLRADSDDDASYYNDASALQYWLQNHIIIP